MTATVEPGSVLDLTGSLHRLQVAVRAGEQRRSLTDLAAGVSVALLGAVVVGFGIGRYPALGGDEGIYRSQAWAVMHGDITPYTYTYDHPFFGWAQISPLLSVARWLHWGGDNAVVDARAVMTLYAFAVLLLTYGCARRFGMRLPYAVATVLLLGLCPLFVVDARQVYLDNIAMPWALGAVYLALSPGRRQWTYGIAGVLFGVAVLSKETLLLLLPALGYLVWTRAYRPIRAMSVVAFTTLGTSVVLVYPLFALLRNELFPGPDHVSLWTNGIMYQLASRKGSGSLWEAGSARQQLVGYWLSYDTVLLTAGTLAAIACLFVPRLRVIGLAVLLWSLPVLKPGGYLPAMYVIAVLPFAALAVGGMADHLHGYVAARVATWRRPWTATAVAAVAVVALVLSFLPGLRTATVDGPDLVAPVTQAEAYVETAVPLDANIVVDPAFWTDLVDQGRPQPWAGVISYYQFDLDPVMSSRELPHGWQDIDYVLETPSMSSNIRDLDLTRLPLALSHSTVVRTFGSGDDQIVLRRVEATPFNHQSGGTR